MRGVLRGADGPAESAVRPDKAAKDDKRSREWKRLEASIDTSRLVLEPLMPEHAALLFEPLQNETLYRFFDREPPASVAELRRRFRSLARGASQDGGEAWLNWVALCKNHRRPIGMIEVTIQSQRCALLAYMVFPSFWREGYAREGCTAVMHFLLKSVGVTRFQVLVDTRNTASIRLAEFLGFRRLERIQGAAVFKGRESDEYRYELRWPRS